MTPATLGNKIYKIINETKKAFFKLGELAQLSYSSFETSAKNIRDSSEEQFILEYPIGCHASGSVMMGKRNYSKSGLIEHYSSLAKDALPLTAIYQLVTGMETMLAELVGAIISEYPKKLSGKKKIELSSVLESESIEAIHSIAIDSLLYELSYKSPKDFAEEIKLIMNVNLLEVPAFHQYIEVKATRDIYIHNRGIANAIYIEKAGSRARVKRNHALPVTINYFLQAYEACLQISETLCDELHKNWESSEYEAFKQKTKGQLGSLNAKT